MEDFSHFFDGMNPNETPQEIDPKKFKRYSMTDLLAVELPKWLVRDLLYERQIAVFFAPSGSYKSFLTLGLCSMLAHSMMWQGRRLKKRRIIYLAGEGFPLFGLRRLAWFKYHCKDPRDDNLEVINGTVNLMDDAEVDAFIASAQDALDTDVLVIDTLSASTIGHDENTSPVMTKAVANAQRIGQALCCAVIIVHHPGKDVARGLRGHSALSANIDAVWCGEKIEDGNKLVITTIKQKDGIADQMFGFAVHRVPLGVFDDDGVEITSLVLDPCDVPEHIKEQRNDFTKIVSVLKLDENPSPSIAQVVQRLLDNRLFDCKARAAATRVSKAIPVEWKPCDSFGKKVEVRRVPGENGQAHKITMRLLQADAK